MPDKGGLRGVGFFSKILIMSSCFELIVVLNFGYWYSIYGLPGDKEFNIIDAVNRKMTI
jgi:hypothetical protein